MSYTLGLIIMLIILLGLMVLNVPIYIALLVATVFLQVVINGVSPTNVVTGIYEALTKTSLMAVPFFVFAGAIMAETSLGKRLIDCFEVALRSIRSGLAMACLFANAFFGGISGSAPAATSTFGKVAYEPLKQKYDDHLATGLITSAGALSSIIPPSITMILYCVAAGTSTTKIFLSGILPGVLICVIVGIYLAVKCRKLKKEGRANKKEFLAILKRGIPVLILPVLVLGGIYSGFFTPTEAGAVSAVYALVVSTFVLKDMKSVKQLFKTLRDAAKTTAQIFILVAISTVFSQSTAVAHLPDVISTLMGGLGKVGFLLILNLILLIVGCFLDAGCATLILVPIIMPVATALGVDPIHLGIIFVINLSIGLFTPPFGLNIFVSQGVLNKSLGFISRSLLPYIGSYIIALLMITFIPSISLLLVS